MEDQPFASLITMGSSGLFASHIPMVLEQNGAMGQLRGHISRANTQWRDYTPSVEALAIFSGPQHYITPNWYPSKTMHGKAVPTWNYAVVHAYGRPEVMSEKDWLLRHVTELSAQQERSEAAPWKVSDAPDSYVDVMLRGIVGFRFTVTRLEGKWKMSQNRDTQDQAGVVQGLNARATGDDLEMADIVARKSALE